MYRTFDAVYMSGQIVPLEVIEAQEQSKLLVIVLDEAKELSGHDQWQNLKGKYRNTLSTVDEFISRKQAEKSLEL